MLKAERVTHVTDDQLSVERHAEVAELRLQELIGQRLEAAADGLPVHEEAAHPIELGRGQPVVDVIKLQVLNPIKRGGQQGLKDHLTSPCSRSACSSASSSRSLW